MRSVCLPCVAACALVSTACSREVADDIFDPTTTGETGSTSTTSTTDDTATGSTTEDETTSGEDTSSTTEDNGGGQICGDGSIDGTEQCDCGGEACTEEGLGGLSCADITDDPLAPGVLTGGTLGCNPASCRYVIDECTWCGDGEVNGNETCEPDLDIETDCAALGRGVAGVLTCAETCQIDTSNCTSCFIDEAWDSCPSGWTAGAVGCAGAATSWECGATTDYAGGPGIGETGVWGTNLDGPYANSEGSTLTSPVFDLSDGCMGEEATMTIRHWYDFEGGGSNADGGLVQVSTNGTNWTTLAPVAGSMYGANTLGAGSCGPVHGAQGFSGQSPDESMWVESVFDVSAYVDSETVQFRFVFGSDGSGTVGGWYIDRFTIQGGGVPE
jgi:hypothetical protein